MATPGFLRAVIELATCETLDALLHRAITLVERELGQRATIELYDGDDTRCSGDPAARSGAAHRTWIGLQYTLGAIYVSAPPADADAVELLAHQLAPLAERLIEREASERRTIREDIDRLYERRIRDALIRCDWNASSVARELSVSRGRVAEVARRWRTRSLAVFRSRTAHVTTNTDTDSEQNNRSHNTAANRCTENNKQHSQNESVLHASARFL